MGVEHARLKVRTHKHHRAEPIDDTLRQHLLCLRRIRRGQIGHEGRPPDARYPTYHPRDSRDDTFIPYPVLRSKTGHPAAQLHRTEKNDGNADQDKKNALRQKQHHLGADDQGHEQPYQVNAKLLHDLQRGACPLPQSLPDIGGCGGNDQCGQGNLGRHHSGQTRDHDQRQPKTYNAFYHACEQRDRNSKSKRRHTQISQNSHAYPPLHPPSNG